MMNYPLRSLSPWLIIAVALTGSVAVGCGSPGDTRRAPEAESPRSNGVLEGVVTWTGPAVPTPTVIDNSTDPQVCGQKQTLDDMVVSSRSRGVVNVIVALRCTGRENSAARVPPTRARQPAVQVLAPRQRPDDWQCDRGDQ